MSFVSVLRSLLKVNKTAVFLSSLLFFLSACSSKSIKNEIIREKVSKIFENDEDTFLIEPLVKNANSDKLVFYFHGSSGPTKFSLLDANQFAYAGFKVVHLCWYNCNKRYLDPLDPFVGLELRFIANKIQRVLNKIEHNQNSKIYFVGFSRGAELAEMLITYNISAEQIIPQKVILVAGISATADSRKSISRTDFHYAIRNAVKLGISDSKAESWKLNGEPIKNRTPISIEKYRGSLMLVHGEDDKIWSVRNAFQLAKNYEAGGKKAELLIIEKGPHAFPDLNSEAFKKMLSFLESAEAN